MLAKRVIPSLIILVGSIIGIYRSLNPCVDSIDQTLQSEWQDGFSVKLERIPEKCSCLPWKHGANFVVSSRAKDSAEWKRIVTFHSRHMMDIPPDAIDIKSENVAAISLTDMNFTITFGGSSLDLDFGRAK